MQRDLLHRTLLLWFENFDITGCGGDVAGSIAGDFRTGDPACIGFRKVGFGRQKMDGHIAGGGFNADAVAVAAVDSNIAGGSLNIQTGAEHIF